MQRPLPPLRRSMPRSPYKLGNLAIGYIIRSVPLKQFPSSSSNALPHHPAQPYALPRLNHILDSTLCRTYDSLDRKESQNGACFCALGYSATLYHSTVIFVVRHYLLSYCC